MKSRITTHTIVLMVITILAFAGLAFILFEINTDLPAAINVNKDKLDISQYLIGISHMAVLIFHLLAIIYVFFHFKHFKEMGNFKVILLVLLLISLFGMGVEKVMIDEIAGQYRNGMSINELSILNAAYVVNGALCLLTLVFLLRTLKLIAVNDTETQNLDDGLFTASLCLGIVAGIGGIYLSLHLAKLANMEISVERLWVMIPFYFMFLSPFALALFYWFVVKRKQNRSSWFDEKQVQDMLRASIITLLLSIPGLSVLWFFRTINMFSVFFYYVFMVLFIFSVSTLYLFKFED